MCNRAHALYNKFYKYNMASKRSAEITRQTKETKIDLKLDLDDYFEGDIDTGSAFLDHMLDLFRKHSGIGLSVVCKGDSEIDMHHTTEDIAITLGGALAKAIGDKSGIERYGFYFIPMDEALARVVLDLSGRISYVFEGKLTLSTIGNLDTELITHFFESLAQNVQMNLHIDLIRGSNAHHCIEGIFKAFARALAMAISPSKRVKGIPSTKGTL